MAIKKTISFYLVMLFTACGGNIYPPVENPLDAGRQFIDAIFKGNFKRANQLMLNDEKNQILLQTKLEDNYHSRNSSNRNNLGLASINISNVTYSGDSLTIITFFNYYTNKPTALKVVKQQNSWLIDLKSSLQ